MGERPRKTRKSERGEAVVNKGKPWVISGFLLVVLLLVWHLFTLQPSFDP